jgi:hypothetical protein
MDESSDKVDEQEDTDLTPIAFQEFLQQQLTDHISWFEVV